MRKELWTRLETQNLAIQQELREYKGEIKGEMSAQNQQVLEKVRENISQQFEGIQQQLEEQQLMQTKH